MTNADTPMTLRAIIHVHLQRAAAAGRIEPAEQAGTGARSLVHAVDQELEEAIRRLRTVPTEGLRVEEGLYTVGWSGGRHAGFVLCPSHASLFWSDDCWLLAPQQSHRLPPEAATWRAPEGGRVDERPLRWLLEHAAEIDVAVDEYNALRRRFHKAFGFQSPDEAMLLTWLQAAWDHEERVAELLEAEGRESALALRERALDARERAMTAREKALEARRAVPR